MPTSPEADRQHLVANPAETDIGDAEEEGGREDGGGDQPEAKRAQAERESGEARHGRSFTVSARSRPDGLFRFWCSGSIASRHHVQLRLQ